MSRRRAADGMETSFAVRSCDSPLSLEEYQCLPKHPLYLVLDNLRSAFNVGSLFRTADTARLAGILTCGYTAHPPHPKLDKTALGTLAYIPTAHFATAVEAVASLKAQGIPVWGLETTSHSRSYTGCSTPARWGWCWETRPWGWSRQCSTPATSWCRSPCTASRTP